MTRPVSRTLIALAAAGGLAAPLSAATSLKDDVVTLNVGVRIQTRASIYDATDADGDDFSIQEGREDAANDPADFQVRRTRLYLYGYYGDNVSYQLVFQGDNIDRRDNGGGRNVDIRYAWLDYKWKVGEDWSSNLHFGLDKPFHHDADLISAFRMLFPTRRPAGEHFLKSRAAGLGLRVGHPWFRVGVDVQNNSVNKGAADAEFEEGFFQSARVEATPLAGWMIDKRQESYVGRTGHALVIGADIGLLEDGIAAGGVETDQRGYGADVLFWWNRITALADMRWDRLQAGAAETEGFIWSLQGGYAIPLANGWVVEPALRWSAIDRNRDDDDEDVNFANANVQDAEAGNSGTQIDIGVNLYLRGHDHKVQLQLQLWEAEAGEGDATIVRLQHQLAF